MIIRVIQAIVFLMALQFLSNCKNQNPNKDLDKFLDGEISDRLQMLRQDSVETNELAFDFTAFNRQIQLFILMIKDIENLKANSKLANAYFEEKIEQLNVAEISYNAIHTDMTLENIATQLKQNELVFLNACVLKSGRHNLPLNTVQ